LNRATGIICAIYDKARVRLCYSCRKIGEPGAFLTLITLSLTTTPLMAMPFEVASLRQTTIKSPPSADNSVLAEETQWSISYNKWITDWEWV
jgi:hypothetical protein